MARSGHRHFLVLVGGDGESVFPLREGKTSVGRSPRNDVTISESSVSRFHCTLECSGDTVRLFDALSRNSTRMRPQGCERTEAAHGKALHDGDTLIIGRAELLYRGASRRQPEGAVAAAAPPCAVRPDPPAAAPTTAEERTAPVPTRSPRVPPSAGTTRRRARAATRWTNRHVLVSVALFATAGVLGAMAYQRFGDWKGDGGAARVLHRAPEPTGASPNVELRSELDRTRAELERLVRLSHELEARLAAAAAREPDEPGIDEPAQGASNEEDPPERVQAIQTRILATREAIARLAAKQRTLEGAAGGSEPDGLSSRDEERGSSDRGATAVHQDERAGRAGWIESADDGAVLGPDRSGHTAVVELPDRIDFSREDLAKAVGALKEKIGDYGRPSASPEDLEPDLTRLERARGSRGAAALIELFEYSQKLTENLEKTVAMNKQRVEALLAKAEADYGGMGGEGSRSREGSYARHGPELEQLQRVLELSEKTVEIKEKQRERLLAFQQAVGLAFGNLATDEAFEHLAKVFPEHSRDPELQLWIAGALRENQVREAIPTLVRSFHARDPRVRDAVRTALVALVGEDLGTSRRPWEEWWAKNGDGSEADRPPSATPAIVESSTR